MNDTLQIYSSLNILCIDDDLDSLDICNIMFSMLFNHVYIAQDGEEGLEIFQKESIDIILTDYSMPKMTGLEMSEKIREIDATIPIILLTALENLEILRHAIDLGVTSFIKKPISSRSVFSTLEFVAKSVLADRLLLKTQKERLSYSNYQETLTYQKENLIIRDDLQNKKAFLNFSCEVFYKPKDILSGDSYSIREISKEQYFIFLVDGMGKGISAAATAMLCSAFVNYQIDHAIKNQNFLLHNIVERLLEFIAPNLLEDEVVSATFLHFNAKKDSLEYVMFSMPAFLCITHCDDTAVKMKSNNPPLSAYTQNINITTIATKEISKILVFTDGLNENSVEDPKEFYGKYLLEDFTTAATLEIFEEKRAKKVVVQEDDITYIFIKAQEKSK